jgi:hypothetical protein
LIFPKFGLNIFEKVLVEKSEKKVGWGIVELKTLLIFASQLNLITSNNFFMEFLKPKNLLTKQNAKTIKGEKLGYVTHILYMSPHRQNSKGINLCSHASKECANACLFASGLGGIYTGVQRARINKSEYYIFDRVGFLNQLKKEIEGYIKKSGEDFIPVFRLNGTTDIPFEKFKIFEGKNIFECFPNVQFYDYTKNPNRMEKELPSNYHLTFSRSEDNHGECLELLKRGFNVAMVFDSVLPESYKGYKVVNGDEDDLRFLDGRGVIVGLKYKRITKKNGKEINENALKGGFVLSTYKHGDKIIGRINKLYQGVDMVGCPTV